MNTAEKEHIVDKTVRRIMLTAIKWGTHQSKHAWPEEVTYEELIEEFIEYLRKIPEKSC